jgi:iron complex transport system substrate-binding protein
MRIVKDDLDREILIPTKITRVVSTAPSVTEMIFAAGGGDRLVGVTTFCNYPEEAKSIAKIGDTMNPNMESIVAQKPDIVFVSTASQIEAFTKTLEQNGIAVYVTNPMSLGDIYQSLIRLGEIFSTREQAEELVTRLVGRADLIAHAASFVEPRAERTVLPRVFVQISREPLFTIGKESFLTSVIRKVYGQSVTANVETAYPKLSKETALALNPEVIILSASDDNREPNEVFKNSPAVKNGRVYSIDADLLSRPGPRLVDALEQIAKLLHPEKFK